MAEKGRGRSVAPELSCVGEKAWSLPNGVAIGLGAGTYLMQTILACNTSPILENLSNTDPDRRKSRKKRLVLEEKGMTSQGEHYRSGKQGHTETY